MLFYSIPAKNLLFFLFLIFPDLLKTNAICCCTDLAASNPYFCHRLPFLSLEYRYLPNYCRQQVIVPARIHLPNYCRHQVIVTARIHLPHYCRHQVTVPARIHLPKYCRHQVIVLKVIKVSHLNGRHQLNVLERMQEYLMKTYCSIQATKVCIHSVEDKRC